MTKSPFDFLVLPVAFWTFLILQNSEDIEDKINELPVCVMEDADAR